MLQEKIASRRNHEIIKCKGDLEQKPREKLWKPSLKNHLKKFHTDLSEGSREKIKGETPGMPGTSVEIMGVELVILAKNTH